MKLLFPNGEHAPVDLKDGLIRIGSAAASDVLIAAPGIAPSHCEIETRAGIARLKVQDTGHTVVVNGRQASGETVLKPGDAAGWKANSGVGHCLINRGTCDAVYIEVGTRTVNDTVVYSDIDMRLERDKNGARYLHKTGESYPPRKA